MKLQTLFSKALISSLLLFSFLPLISPFSGDFSGTIHIASLAPTKLPSSTSPLPSPTPPRRIPPGSALPPAPPHLSPAPPHRAPATTLDPKQLLALQSLGIPTSKDPCSSPENITVCDSGIPFRHLTTLRLLNCSSDTQLSPTAMKSLSTLRTLTFINCPIQPVRFPPELVSNLESFTCINSFHRLTGVWLARLANLTDLTVTHVPINASGPSVILHPMKDLRTVTIQRTNLTGFLPRKWHLNLTSIDLSGNNLRGTIPLSLTRLSELRSLNLSSNKLTGTIPETFGDLLTIKNVSLASNSLSGPIPSSLAEIPALAHLDLSSNQLNGSVPGFLAEMKGLKYLNLENNNFQGIVPFNTSFIKNIAFFKISGNDNLCYNHSTVSSKLKLGVAQCDSSGLPMAPPASYNQALAPDDSADDEDDDGPPVQHKNRSHGPSSIVLGVAIALSSIVFLIIFFVLLSKCCKR